MIILLLTNIVSESSAQTVSGYYNQAEQLYKNHNYFEASQVYEKYLETERKSRPRSNPFAIEKKVKGKTNIDPTQDAVYHLADCYRMVNDYVHAEKYYRQATHYSVKAYPAAEYWYAVCLRANGKYDSAAIAINHFLEKHTDMDPLLTGADREMENLKFIRAQSEIITAPYQLTRMGDPKDKSAYALSAETGDSVIFTSMREEVGKDGRTTYNASLFESADGIDPVHHGVLLQNTELPGQQNGLATVSRDGNRMFFTRWTKSNGVTHAAIFTATRTAAGWSTPVIADAPLNEAGSNSTQPFLTSDGRYLIFSSDRTGGAGGYDLWYAALDTGYVPLNASNMGNVINTTGDEEAPYFHAQSRTLVYASNGFIGMGGFDIFSAKGNFNLTNWATPENAGAPINSSKDDIYFVSTDDENIWNTGWVSSDRASDCCLAPFSIRQNNAQYVSGSVVDCSSLKPLASVQLTVTDLRHAGRVLGKLSTDSNGNYAIELHNSAHFKITADKTGYVSNTKDVAVQLVPGKDTISDQTICVNMIPPPAQQLEDVLKALTHSSKVGNFAYKKAVLNDSAHDNLDSLAKLMIKYPTIVIQVEGYTDGIGGEAYNLRLAQKRVDACIRYLVNKGVPASRLVGKAFGECCPIEVETVDGKDNPAAREQNRRVEYKVLTGAPAN